MNLVVRRRLAAGALLASSALVAGLLLAPSSNAAAGGVSISPSSAVNTENAAVLTYNTTDAHLECGGTATYTRVGGGTPFDAPISAPTPVPTGTVKSAKGTEDFTDEGAGVGNDGPADAGVYNVSVAGKACTPPVPFPGGGTDTCTNCFTVLSPGPVSFTSITPTSLRPGNQINVKITGNNFERGVRVDFLLPDGTIDPLITATAPPTSDNTNAGTATTEAITTRTTIQRRAKIDAADSPGARGMRISNLDGNSVTCTACFFVAGKALTGMSPTGGSNDPAADPITVTFTGPDVVDGQPRLEFVGASSGGTTKDALTILGTKTGYTPTSMTAIFDLDNAAPGKYQGVIRDDSSGITNACEQPACPEFTVVQPSNRKPPTVTGLDRDPNTAGNQKDQPAGTTRTFDVIGTNFSKGVAITTSATKGVTVTGVEFVSPTLAKATIQTAADATTGDYDVTATLTDGTASAVCKGCYTVTAAQSTASPTNTATSTACPTASASSTASPSASSSPSATPTATVSPSGGSTCGQPLTITASPKDIVPTQASTVRVHGAPNQDVDVYAYSRPKTDYAVVRSGKLDANGNASWTVTPGGNTRLYAHYRSGTTKTASNDSPTTVITVHTSLSLSAYRDGPRKYHFQGTNLPRRPGQLITLYRYAKGPKLDQYCVPTAESDTTNKSDGACKAIITSQADTGPNNTWRIDRTFSGNGQFYFVVRTSENINNGRGHSNQRLTVIR